MNVAQVTAEILKREGVDVLFTYPLNPLTESAAAVNIRPIVVRQERVGVHMADPEPYGDHDQQILRDHL